jgi:hypothetical protein
VLVGEGAREVKIKSDYSFRGVRRDALVSETIPAGGSVFCNSTMPYTDARLTATVETEEEYEGQVINFKNSGNKSVSSLDADIPASLNGTSTLTVTQSNGSGQTSADVLQLGKAVYGGSVETVAGELTETWGGGAYNPASVPADLASIVEAEMTETTATGAIASFGCTLGEYPMKSVLCEINPVQSGSGEPAPDNVRPISGFTGLTLTRTGKNLANFIDGKGIATDGTIIDYASRCATVDPIKIDPTKSYKVSSSVGNFIYAVWNGSTLVRRIAGAPGGSAGSILDTSGGTDLYVCGYSNDPITVAESKPMVELGSTATAYVPYVSNAYPISWQTEAGTVYGGMLDVVSGLLTVTMASVDLGTLDWSTPITTSQEGVYRMRARDLRSVIKKQTDYSVPASALCSSYGTIRAGLTYDCNLGLAIDPAGDVVVYDPDYNTNTSMSAFAVAMSGVQLVYELAAPVTYQLTPTEVDSLLGANNMWHDANGNTTADYYDGDISDTDVMTESGALISGEKIAYPLAAPAVSTLADTLTPTLLTGDVTLQTTPSGNIVLNISKTIPAQYPLGGALFSGVSNGDVLVFDGIDGKITKNGANAAASVTWTEFPQLEPGENVIASLDAVTVEYYPTYL